jgi:predicted RNA-binding protein with PUA-like domain
MRGLARFWLFKSEPSCFSIDDLVKRPDGTESWDGVRNYQARNFLRDDVRLGDGVLFYHSSIPHPAVVGTAEVVREAYPDRTAFDPASEHFDPRSKPDKPTWYMVDIRFTCRFTRNVTLEMIRHNPNLSGMELLRRSRLSIQPVTKEEWETIVLLGGAEDFKR